VAKISEREFRRIVDGLIEDREVIIRSNPIGSRDEILLWMLLSCLVSYLSLEESETPCFRDKPDASVYLEAIEFVLRGRKEPEFDSVRITEGLIGR
jgi:hypothetical protein